MADLAPPGGNGILLEDALTLPAPVIGVDGPVVTLQYEREAPSPGSLVTIATSGAGVLEAEVVERLGQGRVRALAFGPTEGVARGDTAVLAQPTLRIPVGEPTRGRMLDPLGRPLDGLPMPAGETAALHGDRATAPLARSLRGEGLAARATASGLRETGIRAIDLFAPLPAWGVVGVAGAAGVGRTRVLYELTVNSSLFGDAYGVLAYVGARSRDVADVFEELSCSFIPTGQPVVARATLIAATMGEPTGLRARAVHAAVAVATHARDVEKHDVFLVIDDAYRALEAEVEVAAGRGLAPGRGFEPAAVWSELDARRRGSVPGGGRLLSLESIALPAEGLADPLAAALVGCLDALVVLVAGPAACRGVPQVDPVRTVSPFLTEAWVGAEHVAVSSGARASLLRLGALERLGPVALAQASQSPERLTLERARQLRLFLAQSLFVFGGVTGAAGHFSRTDETLRDVAAILRGDLDGVPERCFALAGGLDQVRSRAELARARSPH